MALQWTDDQTKTLRSMWGREGESASSIARALGEGFTRSAVIGKAHRLGLRAVADIVAERRKCAEEAAAERVRKKVAKPAPLASHASAADTMRRIEARAREIDPAERSKAFEDRPGSIDILALRLTNCRWPFDAADGSTRYCGCRAVPARPYCEEHEAMSRPRARDATEEKAA